MVEKSLIKRETNVSFHKLPRMSYDFKLRKADICSKTLYEAIMKETYGGAKLQTRYKASL